MRERNRKDSGFAKTSVLVDDLVGVFSPATAYRRKAYRMAYDVIDGHRTRKKRTDLGGTADSHLTDSALYELRERCRELCRNNPIAKGLLQTERNGVIGSTTMVQARSSDTGWNAAAEQMFKEKMVDSPCDVTGRWNFHKILREAYLSYRRDGDAAIIFLDDYLQAVEGDQIGSPYGKNEAKHFDVVNGVAFSKKTKRLIGYYIGQPSKWGYIKLDSYKKYKAENVQHIFNPDRFSFSRGEPALTSAIDAIDKLTGYIDAELVAAKVNACFSMFISRKDNFGVSEGFTGGISSTGEDEDGNKLEKLQPGTIMYGKVGEEATGIGQQRPGSLFDPFVTKMLAIIGRPLCMPLMLVTLDYSGATFMNARIAYQKAHEMWTDEQNIVVKPCVSRIWRWFIQRMIDAGELTDIKEKFYHEVMCNRWPYVDPLKEALADKRQLENQTITRTIICARQGTEFGYIAAQRSDEEKKLKELDLVVAEVPPGKKSA